MWAGRLRRDRRWFGVEHVERCERAGHRGRGAVRTDRVQRRRAVHRLQRQVLHDLRGPARPRDGGGCVCRVGRTLASVRDATEENCLESIVPIQGFTWIGLVQAAGAAMPADDWTWLDGTPLGYTHWFSGEPNDSEGERARLRTVRDDLFTIDR